MPAPDDQDLIDVVDNEDRPIGTMGRAAAIASKAGFRVAHIFVFNAANELLLQQLGRVRTRDPGRWGSSVAAHLHAGESYEMAAQRRVREELGVSAPVAYVDKMRMNDRGSVKFIGLFEVASSKVSNAEPDHIADLEFQPLPQIRRSVNEHPERFTETFRLLFEHYLRLRKLD